MPPLPSDFLTETAKKYELSPEQQQAFVEKFSSDKSESAIAQTLHISENAFRTRMSGVYRKFSINGKGPGKSHKLKDFLVKEHQKSHPSQIPYTSNDDIEALVHQIREKIKPSIQERCGAMKVLDMTQPIELDNIYTSVNILEKITGRTRLDLAELLKNINTESGDFDRFGLSRVTEERVLGLEAVERNTARLREKRGRNQEILFAFSIRER